MDVGVEPVFKSTENTCRMSCRRLIDFDDSCRNDDTSFEIPLALINQAVEKLLAVESWLAEGPNQVFILPRILERIKEIGDHLLNVLSLHALVTVRESTFEGSLADKMFEFLRIAE